MSNDITVSAIENMTKEELLSESTIINIFDVDNEFDKAKLKIAIRNRAKELKCLKDADMLITAAEADYKSISKEYEYSKSKKPNIVLHNINSKIVERLAEIEPHKNFALNDKGSGELFAHIYRNECRYNTTAKEWYFYNGKVWVMDESGMHALKKAKELADALYVYLTTIEDEQQRKIYSEYVCKLGQLRYREIMIKDSRDINCVSQADFDKDLDLFNCQNGTLNLITHEFRPHNPDDLLSKISNVVHDPNVKSVEWENFINQIMQGDKEKIKYLQKILGYSLTAKTELETCFILYGASTRNGKSTLIETMLYMLGNAAGYGMTMQPQSLAQKQNKDSRQANGDIARLNNCRFLNASEPPKRMNIDAGLLKSLLGRDSITARHLHEREFEFIPHFKLFVNTNFLPLITDDTLFSSGRINVITFDKHFEPHEQDKNLKNRLTSIANISGIFNWCLEGLLNYYCEGAEPPNCVNAATAEYRQNSDKLGNFIGECLIKTEKNSKALDVYNKYKQWCDANGFGCENKSNFFDELRGKNIFNQRGTVNGVSVNNIVIGYEIISEEPHYSGFSTTHSEPIEYY